MALLSILRYPDARLHKVAAPVTVFDGSLKKLVADMTETMYTAPGIGLAATQVDVHKQVIVVDVSERRDSLVVLVNPEIVEATGVSDIEEGCLSVPGIYELVERAERVKVRAYDQNGKAFTLEAQGLLAVCIQHEMDHLQGKVFVEYLSPLMASFFRKPCSMSRHMVPSIFMLRCCHAGAARRQSNARFLPATRKPAFRSCKWTRASIPAQCLHRAALRSRRTTTPVRCTTGLPRWAPK